MQYIYIYCINIYIYIFFLTGHSIPIVFLLEFMFSVPTLNYFNVVFYMVLLSAISF